MCILVTMKMLTTNEAANRLGVTVQRIHQFIKEERLPAEKMGRDYIIKDEDLKLVEDRKPGRPPKQVKAEKYGTIESQTATTRQLNKAFRQAVEEEMAGRKKRKK